MKINLAAYDLDGLWDTEVMKSLDKNDREDLVVRFATEDIVELTSEESEIFAKAMVELKGSVSSGNHGHRGRPGQVGGSGGGGGSGFDGADKTEEVKIGNKASHEVLIESGWKAVSSYEKLKINWQTVTVYHKKNLPGESLHVFEDGGWTHHDKGGDVVSAGPNHASLKTYLSRPKQEAGLRTIGEMKDSKGRKVTQVFVGDLPKKPGGRQPVVVLIRLGPVSGNPYVGSIKTTLENSGFLDIKETLRGRRVDATFPPTKK